MSGKKSNAELGREKQELKNAIAVHDGILKKLREVSSYHLAEITLLNRSVGLVNNELKLRNQLKREKKDRVAKEKKSLSDGDVRSE